MRKVPPVCEHSRRSTTTTGPSISAYASSGSLEGHVQGYLAREKTPTPLYTLPMTLDIGLLQGLRGVRFLMSEVSLYTVRFFWVLGGTRTRAALGSYGLLIPESLGSPYRGTSRIRNRQPPQDSHRALGIGLLQGPRVGRFLMSEVPL